MLVEGLPLVDAQLHVGIGLQHVHELAGELEVVGGQQDLGPVAGRPSGRAGSLRGAHPLEDPAQRLGPPGHAVRLRRRQHVGGQLGQVRLGGGQPLGDLLGAVRQGVHEEGVVPAQEVLVDGGAVDQRGHAQGAALQHLRGDLEGEVERR